jgi:hypothetical protein
MVKMSFERNKPEGEPRGLHATKEKKPVKSPRPEQGSLF